jgi:ADP-ribose pyrophosphatase YjhB (NUDIX family)
MEKEILSLFLSNKKLKFNEIEKLLSVRSNKLDYHLKKLINKKVLEKNKDLYQLTDSSEYLIPYISDKKSALPVILILIGNKKHAFLHKRTKRPYENMLSLPGGRIMLGEKIQDAVKRIMKEKHDINPKLKKINSVSLEFVKKKTKTLHSFLLIFVSAKTRDKIKLTNLPENKLKIIPSDYKLMQEDSNKKILIKEINSYLKNF